MRTSEAIEDIERCLISLFDESIEKARAIDDSYAVLWQNLKDFILSGGKRLRPQMTLAAYEAFGGDAPQTIIPIAAAQELLHAAMLIHDDIIDRDYVRYGVDNMAGRYKKIYQPSARSDADATHYAHSAALLSGDLMLSAGYQLINIAPVSAEHKSLAQSLLNHTMFEVTGGELLDTESSFRPVDRGSALKIARYKTASYSFINPLVTGASLAGISAPQKILLIEYARLLGIAYQLADDLLGVFGSEAKTGKSTVSDIREGKRTYLIEQADELLSDTEKGLFVATFGNHDADAKDIDQVKNLLDSCGAREKTQHTIKEYADKAGEVLQQIDIPPRYREPFESLIYRVIERNH